MENVSKAKEKLQNLAKPAVRGEIAEETDQRILKQKMEFDALFNQY